MASSIFGAEQRIGEPLSALAVLTGRHREKNTRDPVLVNRKRNQRNQRVNDIGNMVYYCNQQGVQAGSVSHRGTACSSPQGRTHRVGYTTQKTKARVEEGEGTPNVPSGRRKSPVMKAALVQANIRQVPAHVRWCQRSRGTNRSRKDFRRVIHPDGIIINYL